MACHSYRRRLNKTNGTTSFIQSLFRLRATFPRQLGACTPQWPPLGRGDAEAVWARLSLWTSVGCGEPQSRKRWISSLSTAFHTSGEDLPRSAVEVDVGKREIRVRNPPLPAQTRSVLRHLQVPRPGFGIPVPWNLLTWMGDGRLLHLSTHNDGYDEDLVVSYLSFPRSIPRR